MRLRIIGLMASAAVSVTAYAKHKSDAPVPIDPPSWFSFEDYPASSLKANEQGWVRYRLLVNDEGGVISCKVTLSSGYPALDNQSCASALQKARFSKQEGNKQAGKPRVFDGRVHWNIPDDDGREPLQSMRTTFTAKLDGQGNLVSCGLSVDAQENNPIVEVCRSMRDTAVRLGIAQREDAPDGIMLISETTKSFTGKPAPGEAPAGLTEIGHRMVRFHINKAGQAADCKEEQAGNLFSWSKTPCEEQASYMNIDGLPVETDGILSERSGWFRAPMAGGV